MRIARRRFIGLASATGLFATTAGRLSAVMSNATPSSAKAAPRRPPTSEKWDMSWVERVNGKHRAVFDSPEASGGAAIFRAADWPDQYKEVYGTPRNEITSVVVLRHSAIPLAMNDPFWERFSLDKREKMKSWDGKILKKNPALEGIMKFISDGGIVLACSLAFQSMIYYVEQKQKLSHEEAEKVAKTYLLPGIILQPSGFFAVLRAQEAGCDFIVGS